MNTSGFPDPRRLLLNRNRLVLVTTKPAPARTKRNTKTNPDARPLQPSGKRSSNRRQTFGHLADCTRDQLQGMQHVAQGAGSGRSTAGEWDLAFRRSRGNGASGARTATAREWDKAFKRAAASSKPAVARGWDQAFRKAGSRR